MPKQFYRAETYRARDSIGYLMKRVTSLRMDRIERAIEGHGVTFTQWLVLMYLRDGIAVTPATLCREMRHDSGALTRVIDHLEERGQITRSRSQEDRRVIELELTRNGRETVEMLIPIIVGCLNEALDVFTLDEARQLKQLLQRMFEHLESGACLKEPSGDGRTS
jgi:DNA-binding MarR family transcriptional regulator